MKIGDQEYLELQGNEFYQVIYFFSQPKDDSKWLAKVRVIRQDTMEFIKGGFAVYEPDKKILIEKIEKRVKESLFPELEKTGAPSDWNSEVRKILIKCGDSVRRVSTFGRYSEDHRSEQMDEDEYSSNYAGYWHEIIRETVAISRMIEELDAAKRMELLTIPDSSLKDPSDAWSLEDIGWRINVFKFFSKPSEEEKKHHELQLEKLARRNDELGWK